jgi:hypothetical protein
LDIFDLTRVQLTPTDAAALATLEKRLDYERIILFRSLAEAYLEKEKQFKEREKQKKRIESEKSAVGGAAASADYGSGIWKWWTGGAADTTPTPDLELTDAVWKELFAAVDDEYLTTSDLSDQVTHYSFSVVVVVIVVVCYLLL